MNSMLCAPFLPAKIYESLFQMFPTKAPTYNGPLALFFQKFWSVVGNDVTVACLDFLNNG